MATAMSRRTRALVAVIVVLAAATAIFLWRQHRAAREAESVGIDVSRTITATFSRATALKVGTVGGNVLASGSYHGALGTVTQRTKSPYSVDYFIDLSALSPAAFRWNGDARVMSIDVPDVTVAAPNIDEARAQTSQQGLFISRAAGLTMQRQAAERAAAAARRTSLDPKYRTQARENARRAVAQIVSTPLAAAGLGTVKVAVRFPDEPRPDGVPQQAWDASTPIADVLRRNR